MVLALQMIKMQLRNERAKYTTQKPWEQRKKLDLDLLPLGFEDFLNGKED